MCLCVCVWVYDTKPLCLCKRFLGPIHSRAIPSLSAKRSTHLFPSFPSGHPYQSNSFLRADIPFGYIQSKKLHPSISLVSFRAFTPGAIGRPNIFLRADIPYGYIQGKTLHSSISLVWFRASSPGAIGRPPIVFYEQIYPFSCTE